MIFVQVSSDYSGFSYSTAWEKRIKPPTGNILNLID